MGDMLSQAEIDALLGGASQESASPSSSASPIVDPLTPSQKDALGEIGNISMGTAATTLFTLLNQKVMITTPKVQVVSWTEIAQGYDRPCVGVRVDYKEGLSGSNILILKESDVKIITNLMMGGDGLDISGGLTEIDLSAIGEAMNQMAGSSSTSLSSMINKKIDIMPPNAFIIDFNDDDFFDNIGFGQDGLVCTSFRMEIGSLIDSEIMQVLPLNFAIDLVNQIMSDSAYTPQEEPVVEQTPSPDTTQTPSPNPQQYMPQMPSPEQQQYMPQMPSPEQQQYMPQMPQQYMPQMPQQYMPQPEQQPYMQQPYVQQPYMQQPYAQQPYMQQPYMQQSYMPQYQDPNLPAQQAQNSGKQTPQQNVNVQAAQFQSFDISSINQQKENMDIIMDVPLEITVELGRTHKYIREILEFGPGTIIELDKLAGEPIDIYVNGKFVAKGEVVVIDENFGIRINDIVSVEKRI